MCEVGHPIGCMSCSSCRELQDGAPKKQAGQQKQSGSGMNVSRRNTAVAAEGGSTRRRTGCDLDVK